MEKILGVKIDSLTIGEALESARKFLYNSRQNIIFTPNPEMLVDAASDNYFKRVLNSADLNLADGFGVRLISFGKIKRVTGVDFVYKLCELAANENKTVFLLGSGSADVLIATKEKLMKRFSGLRIVGNHSGPKIDFLRVEGERKMLCDSEANDQAIEDIIMSAPDILLVGFGHEKQEKWIVENLKNLPSVKIAMGVGGSFDFIAGFNAQGYRIRRAPCFLRYFGLEWGYRLVLEPWRFKRIIKAVIRFPLCVIGDKFHHKS